MDLLNKKKLSAKGREIVTYASKAADLMERHGRRSAFVLAGKNIPLSEVEDILSKADKVDDNLFRLIVEAEKRALANKFW